MGLFSFSGSLVFAQEPTIISTSPNDQSQLTRDLPVFENAAITSALFAKQQHFLSAVVDTFLQYLSQLRTTIEKRIDIFNPATARVLLDRITQHEIVYTGYKNDISLAQSPKELYALAAHLYTFRTTQGVALKREMLSVYVAYFQRVTQRLITSRFQTIQNKIISAKNQGKNTASIEEVFSGAVTLMQKIDTTARQLQNALQDPVITVSLDDVSIALNNMQKDVSSMYALFRKITLQGDEILELTKEENGIQNIFPAGNW